MNHLDLINLFRTFSKQHVKIKHSIGGRHSFFRMNDDAEIINAANVRVDYPVCLITDLKGRMIPTGDISNEFQVEFEIRGKIDTNGDFDAMEEVRSECREIGENYIAWIDNQCDEHGNCGPIRRFDIATVQWEYTEAANLQEYGCRFRFSFIKSAFNQYTVQLDQLFQTEFFIPLLDFDGAPLMDWDDEILNDLE